ncbi:hypothetical protein OH77DRAFT_1517945 [Trametes cingulata]|nr:hypothetical protein OH77DRAFT_1517945 [Trametes cingulata]
MGDSWIPELDFYVSDEEDADDIPSSSPERLPLSLPARCSVALSSLRFPAHLAREQHEVMILEDESDAVPRATFNVLPSSDDKQASRLWPSSPRKASQRRGKTPSPQRAHPVKPHKVLDREVFQSICAMPGVQDRSFEELRAECYAISAITTGAPPKPFVAAQSEGHRADAGSTAKIIPPLFAPSVVTCETRSSAVQTEPLKSTIEWRVDVPMAQGQSLPVLRGEFTFTMPVVITA